MTFCFLVTSCESYIWRSGSTGIELILKPFLFQLCWFTSYCWFTCQKFLNRLTQCWMVFCIIFQFEIISWVLVRCFWFIWIPMIWVYDHLKSFYYYSAGIDFSRQNDIYRHQVLTTKVYAALLANLSYSNFHSLEVVSRYRDPQLQVRENYSHLFDLRPNICKSWCLNTHFVGW